ncbi:siderophore-iron reductase FhuF [Roseomonas sp. M0104]|uniref:Siderophore-iron reductase FhuF n=1 Tax=Teichococcus coralli TaxID=2545983 RepID=A0A845B5E5_9PROT|nr:siderophore-iron reductase FhuF [Pseudoroseomonas coralli]MXP62853.1 siderophore-iron reductase FhuF [Pseudoroseomonas coralli]
MIPDFAPALAGPLAFARDCLVPPDDARPAIPCAMLCEAGTLADIAAPLAGRFPRQERQASFSMWSQYYFARLIYPVLGASLLLGRDLPSRAEDMALILGPDGAPAAFRIADAGRPCAQPQGCRRFAGLLRGHLEPIVQALSEASGASPRLFWCNAGIRCDHVLRLLQGQVDTAPAQRLLFGLPHWAEEGSEAARTNPLPQTVRQVDEDGTPAVRRRVCCLRYRLAEFETGCPSCPLPAVRKRHLH